MVLPKLSQTLLHTTYKTGDRIERKQLNLNIVVSERTKEE